MLDRTPPGRYSVVERGGRLVVIDRATGGTPPTAAQRMAEHDRRRGIEPAPPAPREETPEPLKAPATIAGTAPADRLREAIAARGAQAKARQPWGDTPAAPPARDSVPARIPAHVPEPAPTPASRSRPALQPDRGSRKTVVTSKWWDAKGPRTIELGANGQSTLSGGFVTIFAIGLAIFVFLLLIMPVAAFVAAFLLFQFGGKILAPIGAGIIDKAIAERG